MGCLNESLGPFGHWFGNIHLSGPCNRRCYFCIGQHMMELDSYNSLQTWPLPNIGVFVMRCLVNGATEINLTGTNTDPLLYRHPFELASYLRNRIPDLKLGVRTNGVQATRCGFMSLFDKVSITVCSTKQKINWAMMGGPSVDLPRILDVLKPRAETKLNVLLGPENTTDGDYLDTIAYAGQLGIPKVNLREPYGQPHVGNPLENVASPYKFTHGMPTYRICDVDVTYWDVHYVEVESVNLYASGRISETYPITKGYSPNGSVKPQSEFPGGRIQEQWISYGKTGRS